MKGGQRDEKVGIPCRVQPDQNQSRLRFCSHFVCRAVPVFLSVYQIVPRATKDESFVTARLFNCDRFLPFTDLRMGRHRKGDDRPPLHLRLSGRFLVCFRFA